MKITRDLISDLLPAYVSGEATADTRALVEEMSLNDPEIARLVESARQERSDPMLQNPVSLPPNLERETVSRTRAMLYRRSWMLALALFFTVLPFTFAFQKSNLTFLVLRDQPAFRIFWVVAGFFWLDYVLLGRRLRVR
jgi:anti-sigma factor RsiW